MNVRVFQCIHDCNVKAEAELILSMFENFIIRLVSQYLQTVG